MRTRTTTVMSSIALVLALASPLGAVAGSPDDRHCAYRLESTARTGHVIRAQAVLMGCFPTFAAALKNGSGGAVILAGDGDPSALTEATLRASTDRRQRGSVLIGTEFNLTGYSGESNSYFAPDACQGNTYDVGPLPDTWDNRFESGKGFGGCDHNKKFAGPSFGGTSITCTPNCSSYGGLNNQVSSLRWRP